MSPIITTDFIPFPPLYSGKVRETYAINDQQLLMVTTDRLSAFDCIFPNGIPDKGRLLNSISNFWFQQFNAILPHHLISTEIADLPASMQPYAEQLNGRFMLVKKAQRIDFECVVRGYLYGSGWKEYQNTSSVCGIKLPSGMQQADQFSNPLFTPATKAATGHDENVPFATMATAIGEDLAERIRTTSIQLYQTAATYAAQRNLILVDTKFEFGLIDGQLTLIDEVCTPDSSRYWRKDSWQPGQIQRACYDKQFVRDYLETLDWDKTPPAPILPDSIVQGLQQRYQEVYDMLLQP